MSYNVGDIINFNGKYYKIEGQSVINYTARHLECNKIVLLYKLHHPDLKGISKHRCESERPQ